MSDTQLPPLTPPMQPDQPGVDPANSAVAPPTVAGLPPLPDQPQTAPLSVPPAGASVEPTMMAVPPEPVTPPEPVAPAMPAMNSPMEPTLAAVPDEPPIRSRFLENLQQVNPTPFSVESAPAPTGTPLNSLETPPAPAAGNVFSSPPSAVSQSSIPQESASFVPPAGSGAGAPPPRKPATVGGRFDFLKNKLVLGGMAAVVVLGVVGWLVMSYFSNQSTPQTATKTPSPKNVTLTYWGLWEPKEVMQPLIDAYQQQNPGVKIEYTQQKPEQYRKRLQTAIRDGQGPDIFRYHNTWLPMIKSDLAAAPSAVFPQSELTENFYPVMEQDLVQNRQVMGVPLMYEGLALVYNTNMLRAANAVPPKTWEEVRQLAPQLTIRQDNILERGGIALGLADNVDHYSDILALMILQNSGNPADPTSQNVQHALEFFTIFSRTDKVWDSSMPTSTEAFAQEKVAMILVPSWRIFEIKTRNPNLEFGVAPVPQLGGQSVAWASYWVEGVSKSAESSEEAWKFLRYLSQAEQLRRFHSQSASYRGFGELYPRPAMAADLDGNAQVSPYLEDAAIATSWYLASDTYDEGLNEQMMQYYKDAIIETNQSGDAVRALRNIAPGIQQVLTNFALPVPSPTTAGS